MLVFKTTFNEAGSLVFSQIKYLFLPVLISDSFRSRDKEMRGQAPLQYEDFIGIAIGAHK